MKLSCSYKLRPTRPTCNTSFVQGLFGIGPETGINVIARDVELDYRPGDIVLFAGPSGSGKSSLLRRAASKSPARHILDESPGGRSALVDSLGIDVRQAMRLLGLCGLGEAMLMLRSPGQLSDGQRYRYAIAKAIALGARTVVADEWCAKLDRIAAKVISRNIRKLAVDRSVGFLLATTHDDIIDDLQPNVIVRCMGSGKVEVSRQRPFRRPVSFHRELSVTGGSAADWAYFSGWHYRGKGLGPIRKVFILWHGLDAIGICVFGFGPLSSSARRRAFGLTGPLTGELARKINQNFATVSRIVIDPRYRGAGIAAGFLRRCCGLVSWPWIELVSEMADLVPFCESAGFKRISRAPRKAGPAGGRPVRQSSQGAWGKSGWTKDGFDRYWRRVRFSRPVYYLFDNRRPAQARA